VVEQRSIGGRDILLAVPESDLRGLVISLHGSTANPVDQLRYGDMDHLKGAVVAYPQGSRPARDGFMWDPEHDLDYIGLVIDTLRAEYGLPRPCICGMAGGARMACTFASERSQDVLVVGAVAGLRAPTGAVASPVSVLAFHGAEDHIKPYGGGLGARWRESVPDAALSWAQANGNEADRTDVVVGSELSRTTFGEEGEPGEVTLWTVSRGGHTWPGATDAPLLRMFLGRTSKAFHATDMIWDFYESRL
jgi:polyhydroxybutyrate depolymerase